MSLIVFVSITPLDKGESVGAYVARAVDVLARSGLEYVLTPMGTIVEGPDWDTVMGIVGEAFHAVRGVSRRVSFVIKGDDREGRTGGLRSKTRSLREKLGRDLRILEPD